MRTALLLAGLCLLLTVPAASALLGDVTVEVADHKVTYHDPNPPLCDGDVGGDLGPVEVRSGSGGPWADSCRHYVRVL